MSFTLRMISATGATGARREDNRFPLFRIMRYAVFDTPQNNGIGPLATPETVLRHAV
ncbi:hypothetical protein ACVIJ6_005156 [Bradyrhizobium sp. USDA 4369]